MQWSVTTKIRLLRCYLFIRCWVVEVIRSILQKLLRCGYIVEFFKISWVEHITSKEVIRRMKKKRTFYTELKQRKFECIGYIMRISDRCRFLQLILQGKLQRKRSVGRRRISWLNRRIISSCSGQSPHHHHHSQYPQGIDTWRRRLSHMYRKSCIFCMQAIHLQSCY